MATGHSDRRRPTNRNSWKKVDYKPKVLELKSWRQPQSRDLARYGIRLQTLQRESAWTKEELDNLNEHLAQFSFADRMEHLEVLHNLTKKFIDYQSQYQRVFTPNRQPWRHDIGLFLDSSRTPVSLPADATRIRNMNNAISQRMLTNGWCRSTIQLILQAFHVPGLHLAMLLGPSIADSGPKKDHSKCSSTQCYALQVNRLRFKPSHVSTLCATECGSIQADEAEVKRILQQEANEEADEGIPRIVLPLEGELPSTLKVSERGGYTAVSHVWAHGFANQNNSMFTCQLERLRNFLNHRLGHSKLALLWMDAFCVPSRKGAARTKGMSRIAKTFKMADKILVLDASLLRTSCKLSAVEKAIRILSSDWMRRLWTLEEAMLGCADIKEDKLYFGFSDGYVTFQSLRSELRSKGCPYAHCAVMALERHLTPRINPDLQQSWRKDDRSTGLGPHHSPQKDERGNRFAEIARAVEFRNISKPGDEMLCIASILGLSPDAILQAKTAERKAITLYLTLYKVPITILFCAGMRITERPFRWAPSSFITSENPRKLYSLSKSTNCYGRCLVDGLYIKTSGILFTIPRARHSDFNRVWIQPDKMSPEKLILEPLAWEQSYDKVPEWQGWRRLQQACLDSEQLVLMMTSAGDHEGVVLKVHPKKEDQYETDFLCQVHVGKDRKKQLADVGPLRREETSGYYRLFDHQGEDKENAKPARGKTKEERTPHVRERKATKGSEFHRGESEARNEQGEVISDVKRPVNAICQGQTSSNQMWKIT